MEPASPEVCLFVYGLLLQGEREHGLLDGAALLGTAVTMPEHTLVDLDFYPALLLGGQVADWTVAGHRQQQWGNQAVSRKATANLFRARDGHLLLAVNTD